MLFCGLAAVFLLIAAAAIADAGNSPRLWIVAVAALALAGWLGSVGVSGLRR